MVYVPPKDRVLEHSTSNSQTVFAVTGAGVDTSYNAFSAHMAVADTTYGYVAEPGTAFKSGKLTYSNTNEITIDSSEGESKGTFSAGGTKEVAMGLPAGKWFPTPLDALAFNGMQVNGNVDVSQELLGVGATLTNNTNKYIADSWESMYNHGAATAVVTSVQIAALSFPAVRPGYGYGHQIKATTAITSPANGDFARHRHQIEGWRAARLGWGAAGAQPVSIAFQFYSTGTGVAFVRASNAAGDRAYHKEFTVAAGWQWVTVTIPGDTSGTWQKTTTAGLIIDIFSSGKAASPATPNAWSATPATQTTNSTNLLGTNDNLTIVTGLIVLPGLELPTSDRAALIMRPFDTEIEFCKLYWQKSYEYATALATVTEFGAIIFAVSNVELTNEFAPPMRIAPAMSLWDTGGNSAKYSNVAGGGGYTANIGGASVVVVSEKLWTGHCLSGSPTNAQAFHYAANARL